MISGILYMLIVLVQPFPGAPWHPALPMIPFQTEADCEMAQKLVATMAPRTQTLCIKHREA